MEFRDAEVKDVLRALGRENQLNVVFSDDVRGKLTLSFRDVTLEEALDAILMTQNLSSVQEGNILRIVRSPFAAGEERMMTEIIPVKFADVEEMARAVGPLLSSRGRVTQDIRTNSLLIRDVPENIKKIHAVIDTLDTRTPQVLIEAKIVEAETSFIRELGVQWGANVIDRNNFGTFSIGGRDATGGVGVAGSNFLINLPASVGPGSGGALGISFGNISNTFLLDLQLTALENSGRGRILSSPRVMAQNNKEAKVSTGLTIPVQTATVVTSGLVTPGGGQGGQAATGITNIEVNLALTVTPHVTPGNEISLKILVEKKEADFSREVLGIPTIITREVSTEMITRDGETIVIAGIYKKTESERRSGLPWLSKIPVLGWLFKNEEVIDDQTELLIFVTPRIYRSGEEMRSSGLGPS